MQDPYQYIIFRASEVKDLSVDEPTTLRSVHDDPAVLGVRIPLHHIHFHPIFSLVSSDIMSLEFCSIYMGAPPFPRPPFFLLTTNSGLCILILIGACNTGIRTYGSKRILAIPSHSCSAGPSTTTSATTICAATTATTAGPPSGAWTCALR